MVTDKAEVTGIKAILEQSLRSYDKLPMLEIIFERFTRQLSTSLRNFTSEPVDVKIEGFRSLRFGEYFKNNKHAVTSAIFHVIEWENYGLLVLDNSMIFFFVDLLLGGKKADTNTSYSHPERMLTSIEQGIAKQIVEIVLTELSYVFDQITPTTFHFEKLEANPNFITIVRPGDAIIGLKLKIEVDKHAEQMELVIPYKTIEPIKEKIQQVFLGDKFGTNQEWSRTLRDSMQNIDMKLDVLLMDKMSNIQALSALKTGDTLIMDHLKDQDVIVRLGCIPLFRGKIGKVNNKLAVNIKNFYER